MVARWFEGFGVLRMMLIGVSAFLMALGPVSGGEVSFDGIALFTTLLAPTFYVVMVFVLPLDMTMTRIFMTEARPMRQRQLRKVMLTEGVLLVLMLLMWLPFVLKLLRIT